MAPRPVLVLVLLLALLCSHIALCSSADYGKPKGKASGGRKALLAATASVDGDDDEEDVPVAKPAKKAPAVAGKMKKKVSVDGDDDGEDAPVVKPAKKAPAVAGKIKKKVSVDGDDDGDDAPVVKPAKKAPAVAGKIKKKVVDADAKNQTAKAKKTEAVAAAKGTTTKKTPGKPAVAKAKVPPKVDKAADKVKGKSADSAKASKSGKAAKPEAGAGTKAKKPANSTADAGATKPVKSGTKKAQVEGKSSAKADAALEVDEDVVASMAADGGGGADDDLMSEFRGLPARLQETLMPDLARLSHQSKAYLSAGHGGRWAAASVALLLLLPLCALTALVRRAGAYLPALHRALLLAQAYLAIYFGTLALAAAATGLEPLRFFHAASPAAYAWTQAAQSLGFVAYLVLQVVDLVAVFSGAAAPEEDGNAARALGLAQMVVGLAVGLHYYAAVFHRAAAGEAPRASWRVYVVYAACFVVICACARAERRKKAYLADGAAEEWKKS